MVHNKKFDQDTTGSINGYYILFANSSLLLLPPTIFCMNERVHREGQSKLPLHLRDTPPQRCTAEYLRASSPSLVITSWTTRFWVFSWPKWTRSISRCTRMIILQLHIEDWVRAWSFGQVWLNPLSRPQCSLNVDTVHLLQFLQGKEKNKAWQCCALSVILSGEVNQIISIILEWTKWSSSESSLRKTLLFGLSFIPHSILSFTSLLVSGLQGGFILLLLRACASWLQNLPVESRDSPSWLSVEA